MLELPVSHGAAVLTTAEPPWKDNRRSLSCIPAGRYLCGMVRSPRFGAVYQVHGVPGRGHILLHAGNLAGDSELGLVTHTEGCILVGQRFGLLRNTSGLMQRGVLTSRPALRQLEEALHGLPFTLQIP